MLDPSWANYNHTYGYGAGSKKDTYPQRPLAIGCFGLVNRWGLAEMHGQLYEWCGDLWHPSPLGGPQDGFPWEDPDPSPEAAPRADNRLLRGGSWLYDPRYCRAAYRIRLPPGLRPLRRRRSPLLSPPPSTLHRQSRWKGFQRECTKGPDPLQ